MTEFKFYNYPGGESGPRAATCRFHQRSDNTDTPPAPSLPPAREDRELEVIRSARTFGGRVTNLTRLYQLVYVVLFACSKNYRHSLVSHRGRPSVEWLHRERRISPAVLSFARDFGPIFSPVSHTHPPTRQMPADETRSNVLLIIDNDRPRFHLPIVVRPRRLGVREYPRI